MSKRTVWIKRSGWRADGRVVRQARWHIRECRFVEKYFKDYVEVPFDRLPSDVPRCRHCAGSDG